MKGFNFTISVRMLAAAVAAGVCLTIGCRRTDVREFQVEIPGLTAEAEPAIRQSLSAFAGVERASLRFDLQSKRLTLRYDSMQLAKKNIEMAIAKAGFTANGITPESVGKKAK